MSYGKMNKQLYELVEGDKINIDNSYRKITLDKKGFLGFKLTQDKSIKLHNMVWKVHVGKIPKDKIVCHKDGNTLNNHPDNLELQDKPMYGKQWGKGNVTIMKRKKGGKVYEYFQARICMSGDKSAKIFKHEDDAWEWLANKRRQIEH